MAKDTPSVGEAYEQARQFTKERSSSFYYPFAVLPGEKRNAIYAAYSFAGTVDDAVDEAGSEAERAARLAEARELLDQAYAGKEDSWIGVALGDAVRHFAIPREHFDELVRGMEQDLRQSRYGTWEELEQYCYRAASVIGLITVEVFGYDRAQPDLVKEAAIDMGKALQVTNIMRDVEEDAERGPDLSCTGGFGVARGERGCDQSRGDVGEHAAADDDVRPARTGVVRQRRAADPVVEWAAQPDVLQRTERRLQDDPGPDRGSGLRRLRGAGAAFEAGGVRDVAAAMAQRRVAARPVAVTPGTALREATPEAPVVVVGGGLAGLSAALDLAEAGVPTTLVERRPFVGGKAYSFHDPVNGVELDNGQHIYLRCCPAYIGLLDRLGLRGSMRLQEQLRVPVVDPSSQQMSAIEASAGLPARCTW